MPCWTIEASVSLNSQRLFILDRHFQVDISIMEVITGEQGATLLKESFQQRCFATRDQPLEVATALKNAEEIVQSAAFKWATSAVQAELREATGMIRRLQQQDPIMHSGKATDWLAKMQSLMSNFLREQAAQGSKEEAKLLLGSDALRHVWDKLQAEQCTDLAKYRLFATWRHLLGPDMEAGLADVHKRCLQSASSSSKAPPAAKETKAKETKKNKVAKRSIQDEIDDTAAALLGMA